MRNTKTIDLLIKKGIVTYGETANFLAGKKIKIISDAGNHHYAKVGDTMVVRSDVQTDNPPERSISPNSTFYLKANCAAVIRLDEFEIIEEIMTKDSIKEEISKREKEIKQFQEKLEELDKFGLTEYNIEEIKIHRGLELIDKGLSREEKIAKIKEILSITTNDETKIS